MRTWSLLLPAMLLAGCSLHRATLAPEPPRAPVRDSLFRVDQSRGDSVALRGPVDGVLALLAPDVVYLRAGVPAVYGRDAARALLLAAPAPRGERVTWEPLGGGIARDLHSGFTYGVAARSGAEGGAPVLERYVAYWERSPGAPWRIAAYAEVGAATAGDAHHHGPLPAGATDPPPLIAPKRLAQGVAGIRAADSLFSDLADRMGVAFAFSHTVAPDGVVFGTPELVVGPAAIDALYTTIGQSTSLTWHPVYAQAAGSLDLGFTVGEYSTTSRGASGAAVQRFGKYLTVWRREPGGDWKFVVDGGNATPSVQR